MICCLTRSGFVLPIDLFVLDLLYAISVLFMHLSRFSEDLILLSTSEFGFIDIHETFCTGSSIMPQKKNPDSLELIRGCCAKAYANLNSVLVMMKGLPLSYNRDMQFDKEPLFASVGLAEDGLKILAKLTKTMKVNRASIEKSLEADTSLFALDLADYLVGKNIPFSEAHELTGQIVTYAQEKNVRLSSVPLDELRKFSKKFDS
ncbi:lyase family protein, partial [Candidatus Omnitrophota bacterium]